MAENNAVPGTRLERIVTAEIVGAASGKRGTEDRRREPLGSLRIADSGA
jgi:hypothetical protein